MQEIFPQVLSFKCKFDNGFVPAESAFESAEVVGLYFSGSWCVPCQRFTKVLTRIYHELQAHDKHLEIVFVSEDEDEERMELYYSDMPWLALRWADADHCFHRVGSTVEITSVHDKKFAPFLNFQGVVRRIVAHGTDYKFFVQVQRNALGEPVDSDKQIADLNHRTLYFLREDERGLLPCKTTHIRHLWQIDHPPPPQETQLAKRQRLGGTDGATGV